MLDLLKAAAQAAQPTGVQAHPDDIISLSLEYETAPDIAAARTELRDLLGADTFDLFAFSPDDPDLLILQFPGVALEQSPDFLFQEAEDLRQSLDLVSVTPEILPVYLDIESDGAVRESVGDALDAICRSNAPSPKSHDWAIEMITAKQAWAAHGVDGSGIRVGQPDTGVATHRELAQGLRMDLGFNFLDGIADPTDPLLSSMASPGHGTRTSSAVISRRSHLITGTAPGAELVPLRATNSVVIGAGRAVAGAIRHARVNGCHIVTMSLGGPFGGRALRREIAKAVDSGMIVLAAAGNCVRLVSYPARDRDVIAVAAVDEHANPWRGSCRGRAVDVSAPGENVHVGTRIAGDGGTSAAKQAIELEAQGTSYAVALTAGVAALWLEKYGPAAVRQEAQARGISVQELFRSALRLTARVPPDWNSRQMGTGIVDAEKLLDLPLSDVPGGVQPEASPLLAGLLEDDIPVAQRAEAGFVSADWSLRAAQGAGALLETGMPAIPTPGLAALLGRAAPADFPTPALILEPKAPPPKLNQAFRRLAVSDTRGGLESSRTVDEAAALSRLRAEGKDQILTRAKDALRKLADARATSVNTEMQDGLLTRLEPMLEQLTGDDPHSALSRGATRASLEALVRLTGRPALRVTENRTEMADPLIGQWRDVLLPTRGRWQPFVEAVGRIDVEVTPGRWVHAGTGLYYSDGKVITNRHVIDAFADPLPAAPGQQRFHIRRPASIIFDPDARDEATRYALPRVITAGGVRVGRFVNLRKLDLAVLEMETDNGQDMHVVDPVDRDTTSAVDEDVQRLLLVGYPAQPGIPRDIEPGTEEAEFWARINEIYGEDYGVKYLSPGFVVDRPGTIESDPNGWTFTHDATTLGGNSGSAALALNGAVRLAGLHFGGEPRTENFAHDLVRVRAAADGIFDTSILPEPFA